jgi:signal transduction histidine kinase
MNSLLGSGRKACLFTFLLVFFGLFSFSQNLKIDSLKKAIKIYPQEDSLRVNSLNGLSQAYLHVRIPEVKLYAEEALELSQKIGYPAGEAESNRLLGITYLIERPNAQALQYMAFSLAYFQKSGNHYREIKTLQNIARYYIIQKDFDQVSSYLDEALNISISQKNKELEAFTWVLYSEFELERKAFKKSLADIHSAQSLAQNLKNEDLINSISIQRIRLWMAENPFAMVSSPLLYLLNSFKSEGDILDQFYIEELLGQNYLELKQFELARNHFDACIRLSHQYGSTNFLSRSLKDQSRLDSMKGDFKLALRHYSQYMKLKDSLNRSETDRQAVLFESRFANERKNKENQLLILQQSKNKVIIQQQFFGLFILFLALIGLVIILIKLQRLNSQNKLSLEEVLVKNQEIVFKNKIIEEQRLRQEKINFVKDKLFSVISHDMRTPLTQLQGILGLMEVNALKMSEWAELLPALKRNVQTSTEQLDTLLLWSKNQMHGFQTHISQFPIYPLAEKNLHLLKASMEEKGISYTNTIDPELIVEADLEMIQIVIRNLLTNAIKFTYREGSIRISSQIGHHDAIIKVTDTGIGIREEDYDKIFDEIDFTTPGTLGERGTGLGLKLCRDFLNMNGGEIHVESVLNRGSQFIFTLPLAKIKKYKFSSEVK